ncbi:glutamate receptor 1-like [Patiria miniata]|uniref:Ionotropic glutamate receptor C-terminal domain-containing protein n=1 Tax=Patiria miniata TaxID=46514 RepID=A0A914AWK0_PATMI|nr:glutamate receptor 1-like [Patiria miniata]
MRTWRVSLLLQMMTVMLVTVSAFEFSFEAFYGNTSDIDDEYKRIIDDAKEDVNKEYPQDSLRVTHFQPRRAANSAEKLFSTNSFQALKLDVCPGIFSAGAQGLIVPNDVCYECRSVGAMVGNAVNPTIALDQAEGSKAIKMLPTTSEMVDLFVHLINYTKWYDFIVLYDQYSGLDVAVSMMGYADIYGWNVKMQNVNDHDMLTKTLKASRVRNLLLYCEYQENAMDVVRLAIEEGMMEDSYHWMLGNLNMPLTWDHVSAIRRSGAYITRLQVETKNNVASDFQTQKPEPLDEWPYRLRLAYDAVLLFSNALQRYKQRTGRFPTERVFCQTTEEYTYSPLDPEIKSVSFEGLSGEVAFNEHGDRVNYTIRIYMGKGTTVYVHNDVEEIQPLGTWTQNIKHWELKYGRQWQSKERLNMGPFRNAQVDTIKIVSLEEPPYLLDDSRVGIQGFIKEFLIHLKRVMEEELGQNFEYELELVSEGDYGRYDIVTNSWSGLMGRLVNGYADIAAAPMAITPQRDRYVDFTVPFIKSELGVLIKHPSWIWEYPFAPVFPFRWDVWMVNLLAFVVVTVAMTLIGRYNPQEWSRAAERGEASQEQSQSFNVWNTFWFNVSTLFLQSFDSSPRSVTGRVLAAFWFFYCIVMVFLFLFNLTPFLTSSKSIGIVRDVGDLLDETTVDVGFIKDSPAYDFFKYSDIEDFTRFWEYIHAANSMYGDETTIEFRVEEAVQRVRLSNGRYALIHDKEVLKKEAARWPCDLYITGGHFALVEYGLAVQSGSPLRDQLTYAVRRLQEKGIIDEIWKNNTDNPLWVELNKEGSCQENATIWEIQGLYSLTTVDMKGIYFLLLLGMGLAVIIFLIEVLAFQLGFGSSSPGHTGSRQEMQNLRGSDRRTGGGGGMGGPMGGADVGGNEKMWI